MAEENVIESVDSIGELEIVDIPSTVTAEEDDDNSTDEFWSAFEDDEADSLTTVWICDVSFDVPEKGLARDIFACTTKEKLVNRLFSIISSPDLKEPCDFDASLFTTKMQAIRSFFDGVDDRNLFVGLVPVF